MSNFTNSNNNITSTSNSRSNKKAMKKYSYIAFDAFVSNINSTSKQTVENTIDTSIIPITDITPTLENTEVLSPTTSTTPLYDSSTEPVKETPKPVKETPKPVVNIWNLRKQAHDAEETLKKANDTLKKANQEIEKVALELTPKSVPKPDQLIEQNNNDIEGFIQVVGRKNKPKHVFNSKVTHSDSSYKHRQPESSDKHRQPESSDKHRQPESSYKPRQSESSDKPRQTDSSYKPRHSESSYKPRQPESSDNPRHSESSYKPRQPDSSDRPKTVYKPKQQSEYEVSRDRKNKALFQAQGQLINECIAQLSPSICDNINLNMQYVINFRCTLVVKFESDSVVVEVEGEQFEFSRAKFFEKHIFQNKVREIAYDVIPQAWIRFFHDENTYRMDIMKRRD